MKVFPNPVIDIFHIVVPEKEMINNIQILSFDGKLIYKKDEINSKYITVKSKLESGVNLVNVFTLNNVKYQEKIIVQ